MTQPDDAFAARCAELGREGARLYMEHRKRGTQEQARAYLDTAFQLIETAVRLDPDNPEYCEQAAILYNNEVNLGRACHFYQRALASDPPQPLSEECLDAIRRCCPILMVHPTEPFGLRDLCAIHHPERSLIAYHMFWEFDWDFPDTDEPCDHEVAWVAYDPNTLRIAGINTYFHQSILSAPAEELERFACGGRPVVYVQWGKHGSVPPGWQRLTNRDDIPVTEHLCSDYKETIAGGRAQQHPLKRRWPGFDGGFQSYVSLTSPVDPLPLLEERRSFGCGRRNNAIIHQIIGLSYNFHCKREWPDDPNLNL